jgi:hypothetical protein
VHQFARAAKEEVVPRVTEDTTPVESPTRSTNAIVEAPVLAQGAGMPSRVRQALRALCESVDIPVVLDPMAATTVRLALKRAEQATARADKAGTLVLKAREALHAAQQRTLHMARATRSRRCKRKVGDDDDIDTSTRAGQVKAKRAASRAAQEQTAITEAVRAAERSAQNAANMLERRVDEKAQADAEATEAWAVHAEAVRACLLVPRELVRGTLARTLADMDISQKFLVVGGTCTCWRFNDMGSCPHL